jgi:glycosyltransferase involved in cell wall biosynthesis
MSTAHTLRYPGLIRRAVQRGAWIHVASDYVGAEVAEVFGVDPARITTVPLGVTADVPGDAGRGATLAGGPRYVLAIGTIEPRKDLPLLVDAFDALAADDPDLRLVLAGADGWGAEELGARVERSPHRSRIVRLGYVADQDRADLLAGARVLCYPSRYEGFGLPPLEAMAAGTPVVATAVGSIPEVLGDAASLVPPGDRDALGAALTLLIDDDEARSRHRTAGRARVQLYPWARTAEGLAALYRRARAATSSSS